MFVADFETYMPDEFNDAPYGKAGVLAIVFFRWPSRRVVQTIVTSSNRPVIYGLQKSYRLIRFFRQGCRISPCGHFEAFATPLGELLAYQYGQLPPLKGRQLSHLLWPPGTRQILPRHTL